jgi:formylglycine-generating enzyme required for sulfatase activity
MDVRHYSRLGRLRFPGFSAMLFLATCSPTPLPPAAPAPPDGSAIEVLDVESKEPDTPLVDQAQDTSKPDSTNDSALDIASTPTPFVNDQVLFPAGTYLVGCDGSKDTRCEKYSIVLPFGPTQVTAFGIDRYEVTTGEYESCVAAKKCLPRCILTGGPCFPAKDPRIPEVAQDAAEIPVRFVLFSEAEAFCSNWRLNGSLPSAEEWEIAARAASPCSTGSCPGELPLYAWGDTFPPPPGLGNFAIPGYADGYPGVAPVGKFPANPAGIHDMEGNVLEWTAAFVLEAPTNPEKFHIYYGADYTSAARPRFNVAVGNANEADVAGPSIGFRCVTHPVP